MPNYIRVSSVMPKIEVGNVSFNLNSTLEVLSKLQEEKVKIAVLSELSLTSNSLNSLYYDEDILKDSLDAVINIAKYTMSYDMLIFATIPFKYNNNIYEVAVVIFSGKLICFTPLKSNNKLFSYDDNINTFIKIKNNVDNIIIDVPFISNVKINVDNIKDLTIEIDNNIRFDKKYNSTILVNPSSLFESIYIEDNINRLKLFSKENNICLINANPNLSESSSYNIYYQRSYIVESGEVISKNDSFSKDYIVADIDLDIINQSKLENKQNNYNNDKFINVHFNMLLSYPFEMEVYRKFDDMPYIIKSINSYQFSMHIINMLAVALSKRLQAAKTNRIVIGLSGGLDSTLCLIIINRCAELSNIDKSNIYAINMPGFGTTQNSLHIANELVNCFSINLKTIDIKDIVKKHFEDISHDINNLNATYENAQARERTQILMDIANDVKGIVVGTSDLSETAIGFSTYNGDQMSMYNLIESVPKTMIKYILSSLSNEYKSKNINMKLSNVLDVLLNTPISPELLPTDQGILTQLTEKIVGDYILIDFYLYYYLNYNFSIEKIYDLAVRTFIHNNDNYNYTEENIKNSLNSFFDRFFKSQYKRNASPDAPNIGLKGLDSHNEFYAPGDINICKKIL